MRRPEERKSEINRPMIKIAAVAILAACCAASGNAYAANPPRGKFGTQTPARKGEIARGRRIEEGAGQDEAGSPRQDRPRRIREGRLLQARRLVMALPLKAGARSTIVSPDGVSLVAVLPCTNRRSFGIIDGIQT